VDVRPPAERFHRAASFDQPACGEVAGVVAGKQAIELHGHHGGVEEARHQQGGEQPGAPFQREGEGYSGARGEDGDERRSVAGVRDGEGREEREQERDRERHGRERPLPPGSDHREKQAAGITVPA
jgi:hypothetical protein